MLRSFWRIVAVPAVLGFAPGHAEIAYVNDGRIWASRADGSERRLLVEPTRPRETLAQPVWSPDGKRLAYVRTIGEFSSQLMVLDGAGARAVTPLRRHVSDDSPAWSPDGTALGFARFTQGRARYRSSIVVRSPSTGAERVLVTVDVDPQPSSVREPAWSPDGSVIAYTHSQIDGRYFRPQIRTIPAAGGEPRVLLRDAQDPAWSPDGRRLAFASVRDRNGRRCVPHDCSYAGELYTSAADGTGLTRLTENEGDDAGPAWSLDGSRILFTSDRSLPEADSEEVYSVAADGTCLTWLTNGTPASGDPAWRPGTGDRFDPGSCDPNGRPPRVEPPPLPKLRGGLWLGANRRGLLLSRVQQRFLGYADCDRFDAEDCPKRVDISSEPACKMRTFRGLVSGGYRLSPSRGALVAYYGPHAGVRLLSGHTVTMINVGPSNRLPAVLKVIRSLRPYGASRPARRLPPPRIPRRLARRLESADTEGERRLRAALRSFGPYRLASCA